MWKSASIGFLGLLAGCQEAVVESPAAPVTDTVPAALPLQESPDQPVPDTELKESADHPAQPIVVSFVAGESGSPLAPRYSPPGRPLSLTLLNVPEDNVIDGLETAVSLGWPVEQQKPIRIMVARSAAGEPYTKIHIDTDGNGQFNEEAIVVEPKVVRGKIWSSFSAILPAKYTTETTVTENYPVDFWLTVEKAADRPEVLRMSRRGFKFSDISIGDQTVSIILSDSNNDAVFGEGDWWELVEKNSTSRSTSMRKVGDFLWLGDSAFRLELDGVMGNSGRISPFDPGMTRDEDLLARDPYGADKKAVRAEKPLEFRNDVDQAILEAIEKRSACFIKFETTWCGPCKLMTEYVFSAKDVTDAATGVICVKVDGDERKDLVERYSVSAYPTGLMISADGMEVARYVGYQNVVSMTNFLKNNSASTAE